MSTIYLPDPFMTWVCIQFKRSFVASLAIALIAFVASIALHAIAGMVDALRDVLLSMNSFCISVNSIYHQLGLVGQFLMVAIVGSVLTFGIYRCGRFLYQSFRGGRS